MSKGSLAYAVIYVMDFPLQAVLRTDPTLIPAKRVEPAREDAGPPSNGGRAAVPASFCDENRSGPLGGPASPRAASPVAAPHTSASSEFAAATAAINGAAANLPRGTGSARNPESLLPFATDLTCAEEPARFGGAACDGARATSSGVATNQADRAVRPPGEPLALAIVSGDTKKSLVLHVNAMARSEGVDVGMTAPQAQARCDRLVFRQRSPSAEAEAQILLLTCALNVSPSVEDSALGVCTIDVRGLAFQDRSRSVANVLCELRSFGLSATAGIAATPLLARYAACETTSVRTVENAAAFLHALPLSVAEPTPELTDVLRSWGITTIGQFTALPQQEVIRRLGGEGFALWERARGGQPRPLHLYVPRQPFFAAVDLEYEIETTEGVLFILRRFIDRLALELRTAGFVAAEMVLTLKLADDTAHERSFRLPEPTAEEDILFRTLHTYLESLQTDACVVGVSLQFSPVRPRVRQPGLFETGLRDPHGFSETLSRVTAVVGNGQLGTPQLENTHRTDAVKLIVPERVVAPVTTGVHLAPRAFGILLRRFRPPVPVRVELSPQGYPSFVFNNELQSPITAIRGPWTSSGDWWKPEGWSKEEWDVELAIGGLYRLTLSDEGYFIEGEYD